MAIYYLHERNFQSQQSRKHEHYQNATSQLKVVFGFVFT
jgi:hypothetical protein